MKKTLSLMMIFAVSSAFATTYILDGRFVPDTENMDIAVPATWNAPTLEEEDWLVYYPAANSTNRFTLSQSFTNALSKLQLPSTNSTVYFDFGNGEWRLPGCLEAYMENSEQKWRQLGGFEANRDSSERGTLATIAFTNGTFRARGPRFGSNWNGAAVELQITGQNTKFYATDVTGFTVRGTGSRLTVTDGAKVYGSYESVLNGDAMQELISGPGTVVHINNTEYASQHGNTALLDIRGQGTLFHITDGALLRVETYPTSRASKALCVNNAANTEGASLLVDGGATVQCLGALYVDAGIENNGSGRRHSMTASNATIYIEGSLRLGYGGRETWSAPYAGGYSNTIHFGKDTTVTATGGGQIGIYATSHDNMMTVVGTGTVMTNGGTMIVGQEGYKNTFIVEDQAQISGWLAVGNAQTASNNFARISGAGTRLDATLAHDHVNNVAVSVGDRGAYNTLIIEDGAVADINVLVTVGNRRGIVLGVREEAHHNTLIIRNGAAVSNTGWLCIGNNHGEGWGGGSENTVIVSNATYTGTGQMICVGGGSGTTKASTNNTLLACDGAQVKAGDVIVGASSVSGGNAVKVASGATVSGAGLRTYSINSRIELNNGVLSMGSASIGPYNPSVVSNTVISISGTNSLFEVTYADMDIQKFTTLEFNIHRGGYRKTPIQSLNRMSVDNTDRMVIHAEDWAARKGGTIVLLRSENPVNGSLQNLVDTADIYPREMMLTVIDSNRAIQLYSPRRDATKVLVR